MVILAKNSILLRVLLTTHWCQYSICYTQHWIYSIFSGPKSSISQEPSVVFYLRSEYILKWIVFVFHLKQYFSSKRKTVLDFELSDFLLIWKKFIFGQLCNKLMNFSTLFYEYLGTLRNKFQCNVLLKIKLWNPFNISYFTYLYVSKHLL